MYRCKSIFLCSLIIIVLVTSCSKERSLYNALSSDSVSNSTMTSSDKTPNDPYEIYREASSNIVPIGVSVVFADSDIGVSHSVRIQSVNRSDNLSDLNIELSNIDDYILESGIVSNQGQATGYYQFLAVTCEVTKESDSSGLASDDNRRLFSLSNANIFSDELEPCEMMLAGFIQPDVSKLPEDKRKYMIRITEVGDTITCTIVFLVKDIDSAAIMSVARGDNTILFSLQEE